MKNKFAPARLQKSETVDERIEFAVKFSHERLELLRRGDWLNLREDLNRLIGIDDNGAPMASFAGFHALPDKKTGSFTQAEDSEIFALQKDVRSLLEGFVGGHWIPLNDGDRTVKWRPIETPIAGRLVVTRIMDDDGKNFPFVIFIGALRDSVLMILSSLLATNASGAIDRCPECQTPFYRTGKRVFCAPDCMNRAMVRRKRAGKSKPRKGAK